MNDAGIRINLAELVHLRRQSNGLEFAKPKTVYTQQSGSFISGFRGRGIDFEEVRVYQAGDDIRTMDWRVTARTGTAHTKVFREERERPVFIVIDYNPNMFFGTQVAFKSITASKAAAIVAWAAEAQGDRIGGIIAADDYYELKPRARKNGILPLLKVISVASEPTQTTNSTHLAGALARLQRVIKPGSLVFIFSDFSGLDKSAQQHLGLLARQNDILTCFIYDALEKEPPPKNYYTVTNGNERLTINTGSEKFCSAYRQAFIERQQIIKSCLAQHSIPMMSLCTTDPIVKTMNKEAKAFE